MLTVLVAVKFCPNKEREVAALVVPVTVEVCPNSGKTALLPTLVMVLTAANFCPNVGTEWMLVAISVLEAVEVCPNIDKVELLPIVVALVAVKFCPNISAEGLLETIAVPETMEDCPNTGGAGLLPTLFKAETAFCLNMALDETVKGFREAVGADGLLVEPNCAADSFSCALIAKPEALVLKKLVLAGADAKAAVCGLNNP